MDFSGSKPIYIQICEFLCDRVLTGALKEGDRILSVREEGAEIGVNPNTVMRSYERLTDRGIIHNKRGIGYFISPGARERVLEEQRREFLQEEVPRIKTRLELLGLDPSVFEK